MPTLQPVLFATTLAATGGSHIFYLAYDRFPDGWDRACGVGRHISSLDLCDDARGKLDHAEVFWRDSGNWSYCRLDEEDSYVHYACFDCSRAETPAECTGRGICGWHGKRCEFINPTQCWCPERRRIPGTDCLGGGWSPLLEEPSPFRDCDVAPPRPIDRPRTARHLMCAAALAGLYAAVRRHMKVASLQGHELLPLPGEEDAQTVPGGIRLIVARAMAGGAALGAGWGGAFLAVNGQVVLPFALLWFTGFMSHLGVLAVVTSPGLCSVAAASAERLRGRRGGGEVSPLALLLPAEASSTGAGRTAALAAARPLVLACAMVLTLWLVERLDVPGFFVNHELMDYLDFLSGPDRWGCLLYCFLLLVLSGLLALLHAAAIWAVACGCCCCAHQEERQLDLHARARYAASVLLEHTQGPSWSARAEKDVVVPASTEPAARLVKGGWVLVKAGFPHLGPPGQPAQVVSIAADGDVTLQFGLPGTLDGKSPGCLGFSAEGQAGQQLVLASRHTHWLLPAVNLQLLQALNGPWPLLLVAEKCFGVPPGRQQPAPSGLYVEMLLFMCDTISDIVVCTGYVRSQHLRFAAISLFIFLANLLEHLPVFGRMRGMVEESLRLGYYTDELLELLRAEVRFEAVLSLMLNVYGLPFAVHDGLSMLSQIFGIALSIRAIARLHCERLMGAL